ncbi:hypothetical protein ABIE09_002346 [Lysobacter enzymogenes]|uniref:hypothetical protein n=1 Tax=Lysobacter enzymogenes TaxID=69 RepID=UPI003390EF81
MAQKGSEESIRGQVRNIAAKFIKSKSGEVSYSEIMRHLYEQLPSANKNTLLGAINAFRADLPKDIGRPGRGVFVFNASSKRATGAPKKAAATKKAAPAPREEALYEPFADWLVNEVEEASEAYALGGKISNDKWATPDVVGLYQPRRGDHIQFPH